LTDLSLRVDIEKTDQLTELLLLPTLTKLNFEFSHDNQLDRLVNLKIQNPRVEELTLKRIPIDFYNKYSQFVKIFPNVRKADFNFDSQADGDVLSEIKNLRSLKINKIEGVDDNDLYEFCFNNRELEHLDLNCELFCFGQLKVIAEHLSNLKVLILQTIWLKCCQNGSGYR
jgi:hypothetical protein